MKGDIMIRDYFRDKNCSLRKFLDAVEIGEEFKARKAQELTGRSRTKVYTFMKVLEARGIVETVPCSMPDPPPESEWWGRASWIEWRQGIIGQPGKFPVRKWRILGLTIVPIDELLRIAKLDLAASVEAGG